MNDEHDWISYDIHGLVRVRTNLPLPAIPDYFRVESVTPDLEIRLVDSLPRPSGEPVQREVGHTAYDLGGGAVLFETDTPIIALLGSKGKWRCLLEGMTEARTRIAMEVPFFRFPPVRYKVIQMVSRFLLFLLTLRMVERGYAMCHATGVAKDGRAVLFFGYSGTGKSTVAAKLMESGYAFLADDYLLGAPDGTVYCYPDFHKPRPQRVKLPLVKYLGLMRPFPRPALRVQERARVGPVFFLERGSDAVADLDRSEALRRIALLNLEEISKYWHTPMTGVLNHYAYFYPRFDFPSLTQEYYSLLDRFLSHVEHFVDFRSSSPAFRPLKARLALMEPRRAVTAP